MTSQTFKLAKLVVVAMALAILGGCTATYIVSRSDSSLASASKLVSARVVWIETPSVPLQVSKEGRGGLPTITDSDKATAQRLAGQMISTFRASAPAATQGRLATYKISDGADATIELMPTMSDVNIGYSRRLDVKATIRKAGSNAEIWSMTIRVGAAKWDSDEILPDKFVSTLMRELNRAGWLG